MICFFFFFVLCVCFFLFALVYVFICSFFGWLVGLVGWLVGSLVCVLRAACRLPPVSFCEALARRRSQNLGAWRGHLQRAKSALRRADAQCAARVLNACSRRVMPWVGVGWISFRLTPYESTRVFFLGAGAPPKVNNPH